MKATDDAKQHSRWRHRLARIAPLVLVGIVPTVLLCIGIVHVILNHFFSHAPVLLDAGWYSDVVYRAGWSPRNPLIACGYAEWYFGVHFSPLISVVSILSYLVPLERIEWYALFEAIVFLPFGVATYLLASRLEPATALRRLPITFVAALAFTFNGQILRTVTYPHYEQAIAGVVCLVLVAVTTNRQRLAWVLLALALSIREDAGFHAAVALAPLVYLHWRGVPIGPSRRTLLAMVAVAMASSVVEILCQKLAFHGASIMTMVYFGDPIYGHLSMAVIAERAEHFLATCQVMYYPFLAMCVVAILRRDAGYLLGWAAGLPWFALNFLAAQEQKATFEAYAGFPYVVSIFWFYLYGAVLAPAHRRLSPRVVEAAFAGICVLATLGLYRPDPRFVRFTFKEMAWLRPIDRAAVHGFVDVLDTHRGDFGRLYVDYAVAAVALESVTADNAWIPGVTADSIAFHRESAERDRILPDLFANRLDSCTRVVETGLVVCSRERLPVSTFAGINTETFPSIFAFSVLAPPGAVAIDRGVAVQPGATVDGRLGRLPRGTYELSATLEPSPPIGDNTPPTTMTITSGKQIRASVTLPNESRELVVRFDATGDETISYHFTAGGPSMRIFTHVHVRSIPRDDGVR